MTINPYLKLFVASGYLDLATPYLATDYTLNHLELDPTLHNNITVEYYEAGHMMYIHRPSLARLKENLAGFIDSAVPGEK
jgi:carboxypeptidase C (cathepsin A)